MMYSHGWRLLLILLICFTYIGPSLFLLVSNVTRVNACVRASTKYHVTNMRCGNDGWNCSILWYLEDELIVIIWYIHSPRRFHLWLEWSFNVCLFEYVWFQMGAISSGFSKTEIPIFDPNILSKACIHCNLMKYFQGSSS